MAERITQAEFARRIGVDRAAVNQAKAAGRITLGPDGKLDAAEAAREWHENQLRPPPPHPGTHGNGQARSTLVQVQTAKQAAEARLKQLQAEKLQGALVDRVAVEQKVFELARQFRDMVLAWPARDAAQIAAELTEQGTDHRTVLRVLEKYIRALLEELSRVDAPDFGERGERGEHETERASGPLCGLGLESRDHT